LPLHVIARNTTRRRTRFAEADAFLVSIPKSGRTWLRFAIRHYLCAAGSLPFSIEPNELEPRHLPRVVCSHDLWEHLTAPRFRDRIRGKYLIPPSARRTKRIVLAVRDLRDVMVSLHLQLTRRGFHSGAHFDGTLSEMIRDRRFGAERAVDILDAWLAEWRDTGRCLVWSYEEARKDPRASLRSVLAHLGIEPVDDELLDSSVEFASFDNMKAMESENRFDRKLLRPADPSDPESFKVRRGRVGGWVDYLSEEDARLVERAASRLPL
jgi:hypothetical protein